MTTSVYSTYQAAGRPIEFQGLKGAYILIAAAALVADLLLFIILYCCGTPPLACIPIAFALGTAAIGITRSLSRRFGIHGLPKFLAARRLPQAVRFDSRQIYLNLLNIHHDELQTPSHPSLSGDR
jgi:hypothetical protein